MRFPVTDLSLSLLWVIPLVASFVLFMMQLFFWYRQKLGHCHQTCTGQACLLTRLVGAVAVIAVAVQACKVAAHFDFHNGFLQLLTQKDWWPLQTGVRYVVGADGLSLFLILLTSFFFLVILPTARAWNKSAGFLALFFLLESCMMGLFISLDIFLFYVFWELSFIVLYFMVGMFGGVGRYKATLKFFLYGAVGSILMLLAFIYLYCQTGIAHGGQHLSHLGAIAQVVHVLPFGQQTLLFFAIAIAFAIKFPLVPFHSWLMDLYEAAPPLYTVMSGLVLKTAVFGLIRFCVMLFPEVAVHYASLFLCVGVVGILYGACLAWVQTDLRRMMAYSTLSHMGFIVVGIFSLTTIGFEGALYQIFNHSIVSAALFILIQVLGTYYGHFRFHEMGGVASKFRWFGLFFGIAVMGAVGLPGTGSFIGEFLILLGTFQHFPVYGILATLGTVLGAVYMLLATKRILYGPMVVPHNEESRVTCLPFSLGWTAFFLCILIFSTGFCSVYILRPVNETVRAVGVFIFHDNAN